MEEASTGLPCAKSGPRSAAWSLHSPSPGIVSVHVLPSLNSPRKRRSRDDAPTSAQYVPASARHCLPGASQYASAAASSVNTTGLRSPGCSDTRAKPLSSRGAFGRRGFGSWTYNCTTSSPARCPVLRTVSDTVTFPLGASVVGVIFRSSYVKVVYDSPCPNGNSGSIPFASKCR